MPEHPFMYRSPAMPPETPAPSWTLLSSHGQVLACLARDPGQRLRDLAAAVDLTERAVQKLLGDLEAHGLVTRSRAGRRNRYRLHAAHAVAVPGGDPVPFGTLLAVLVPPARGG
jgi:DNA-binding transcriptional ArsR family regulator